MPYKKATSAAPAASHSRTQTTAKAAGEDTSTRESRRASGEVVSERAQPLHGLAGLNARTDAPLPSLSVQGLSNDDVHGALSIGLEPPYTRRHPDIEHLIALLSTPTLYDQHQGALIVAVEDTPKKAPAAVRFFAARIFRAGYLLGATMAPSGGAR